MKTTRSPRGLGATLAALLVTVSGCTTVDVGRAPNLAHGASWGLLPFANHTETPQAGQRAESIAESLLRSEAGLGIRHYPAAIGTETLFEPADRKQAEAGLDWARAQGLRYAVAGSVDEWRYKVGVDGEPAVGLTLQVVDLSSGDVVWSAAGGKTGWSREGLSAVAQKLTRQLLAPVVTATR